MKLTKKSHACVRLEKDGRTLVLDPGGFSEQDAAIGADAILVTHEHPDHFDEGRLRAALEANPAAEIWTLASVAEQISAAFPGRVHTVGHGDTFTAAGFDIQVHGELHAVIHPDLPRFSNSGFVLDVAGTRIHHPGDSFTPAGGPVDVLLLPIHAPWSKMSEVVDFAREVGAPRSVAIHDGLLNDTGLSVVGRNLDTLLPEGSYQRLEPGSDLGG